MSYRNVRGEVWARFASEALGWVISQPLPDVTIVDEREAKKYLNRVKSEAVDSACAWADLMIKEWDRRFDPEGRER